jgi:hypothetical protein
MNAVIQLKKGKINRIWESIVAKNIIINLSRKSIRSCLQVKQNLKLNLCFLAI